MAGLPMPKMEEEVVDVGMETGVPQPKYMDDGEEAAGGMDLSTVDDASLLAEVRRRGLSLGEDEGGEEDFPPAVPPTQVAGGA